MISQSIFSLVGKRVWVAGHRGMVGAAVMRRLEEEDCELIKAPRAELDLRRQSDVETWMAAARPEVVVLAAATVGGIRRPDAKRKRDEQIARSAADFEQRMLRQRPQLRLKIAENEFLSVLLEFIASGLRQIRTPAARQRPISFKRVHLAFHGSSIAPRAVGIDVRAAREPEGIIIPFCRCSNASPEQRLGSAATRERST